MELGTDSASFCAAWADLLALGYLDAPIAEQMDAARTWLGLMPRSNEQQLLLAGHLRGVERYEANGWDLDADHSAYRAIVEGTTGFSVDGRMTAWPDRSSCALPDLSHHEIVTGFARCLDALTPWFEALAAPQSDDPDRVVNDTVAALAAGAVSPTCIAIFRVQHSGLVVLDIREIVEPYTLELIDGLAVDAAQTFSDVDDSIG